MILGKLLSGLLDLTLSNISSTSIYKPNLQLTRRQSRHARKQPPLREHTKKRRNTSTKTTESSAARHFSGGRSWSEAGRRPGGDGVAFRAEARRRPGGGGVAFRAKAGWRSGRRQGKGRAEAGRHPDGGSRRLSGGRAAESDACDARDSWWTDEPSGRGGCFRQAHLASAGCPPSRLGFFSGANWEDRRTSMSTCNHSKRTRWGRAGASASNRRYVLRLHNETLAYGHLEHRGRSFSALKKLRLTAPYPRIHHPI
jgi:hypothetical protein